MSSYGQMQSDLDLLGVTALTTADVGALINKCQREEVEAYPWSFLHTNVVINGNPGTQAGLVTVQQGSTIVTGVGTNFTAAMSGWFIWVGPTMTTPYIVAQFVSPSSLVLTTPWVAQTTINSGYNLQPLYYDIYPLIEPWFVRQITKLEPISQAQLNNMDPSRISTGGNPSIKWAKAPFTAPTTTGHVQVELWPRCSALLPYIVTGKMGSIDLVNAGDLPLLPSAVLEAKTMLYVALTRVAADGDPRWSQMAQQYRGDYQRELEAAKRADMRRAVTLGINALNSQNTPGLDILYNHDYS